MGRNSVANVVILLGFAFGAAGVEGEVQPTPAAVVEEEAQDDHDFFAQPHEGQETRIVNLFYQPRQDISLPPGFSFLFQNPRFSSELVDEHLVKYAQVPLHRELGHPVLRESFSAGVGEALTAICQHREVNMIQLVNGAGVSPSLLEGTNLSPLGAFVMGVDAAAEIKDTYEDAKNPLGSVCAVAQEV